MSPLVWYGFAITVRPYQDFLLGLSLMIIPNFTCGACYFWYVDELLLDPRTRTRIFGVAYNIGAIMFAGTAPFLGAGFIELHGSTVGSVLIGCWVSLAAFFSLMAYIYGHYAIPKFYQNKRIEMSLGNEEEKQELTANDNSIQNGNE